MSQCSVCGIVLGEQWGKHLGRVGVSGRQKGDGGICRTPDKYDCGINTPSHEPPDLEV